MASLIGANSTPSVPLTTYPIDGGARRLLADMNSSHLARSVKITKLSGEDIELVRVVIL